jgi:hypothetical protein
MKESGEKREKQKKRERGEGQRQKKEKGSDPFSSFPRPFSFAFLRALRASA